jgi:phosphate-selective porin OprO/OprP
MVLNPAPGSWEILIRYDGINLNDAGIYGGCFSDVSLGTNYFINKFIAVKFNYTRLMPGKTAIGGDDGFNLFQARMQFSF